MASNRRGRGREEVFGRHRYSKPSGPPRHHVAPKVADFSGILELIEHEYQRGATHVIFGGSAGNNPVLYYPMPDGDYEEGVVWQEGGYWHSTAPHNRGVVAKPPAHAESIKAYLERSGRGAVARRGGHRPGAHTDEARIRGHVRAGTVVRDYVAVDSRGRTVFGPTKDYEQAKQAANAAGGYVQFASTVPPAMPARRAAEAPPRGGSHRSRRAAPSSMPTSIAIATELSRRVHGGTPKQLPGGHRWSDPNESSIFTTYSPEYQQKVVVLISVFQDGTIAQDFFGNENLSELDRYENIVHFLYSTVDYGEMVADLKWVWETVDGYAESWQEGEGELDEARRRPPPDYSGSTAHAYNIEVVYPDERFARRHESQIGHLIGQPLVSQGALRDGFRMEYGPIDRDDYRRLEGLIYSQLGNAVRVRLVQVMYGAAGSRSTAERPARRRQPNTRPRRSR